MVNKLAELIKEKLVPDEGIVQARTTALTF